MSVKRFIIFLCIWLLWDFIIVWNLLQLDFFYLWFLYMLHFIFIRNIKFFLLFVSQAIRLSHVEIYKNKSKQVHDCIKYEHPRRTHELNHIFSHNWNFYSIQIMNCGYHTKLDVWENFSQISPVDRPKRKVKWDLKNHSAHNHHLSILILYKIRTRCET